MVLGLFHLTFRMYFSQKEAMLSLDEHMKFSAEKIMGGLQDQPDFEKQKLVTEMCGRVLERISDWARKNGVEISDVEKLGGGFVNLVLLIHTTDGKSYVAKNFSDKEEAEVSRRAQKLVNKIADEDIDFIPAVISWIDDDLLISEKAEGFPIKKLLYKLKEDPALLEDAKKAFFTLGMTIGELHERTQSHGGNVKETGDIDVEKVSHDFKRIEGILRKLPSVNEGTLEKTIEALKELTEFKHIAIVHGDTHLDQFFFAPDDSIITIVDYDSLRIGDPMFDVARCIASLRDWCRKLGLENTLESELTQSLVAGYRKAREQNSLYDEKEFSYKRVLAYEVKLYLVKLRKLIDLKESKTSPEYLAISKSVEECISYLSLIN